MKAGATELLDVLKTTQESGGAKVSLALVSPCSDCKNQRSEPNEQFPACPRQYWDRRLKESQADDSGVEAPPDYLTRKGREDDAESYENPVSWEEGQVRLIWVAALEENRAILKPDSSVLNPDILNAGFDSQYITCRHLPYISNCREGEYYAGNQLREKNFVLATQVTIPQYDEADPTRLVQLAGFVQKVTPLQKFVVTPGKKSVNPKGT
jgi:hypothetical protein